MSVASRKLTVGDDVLTDFSGRVTYHKITAMKEARGCTSGILFQVFPAVLKSSGIETWIDADWFEPMEAP